MTRKSQKAAGGSVPAPFTDSEWIARIREGDVAAFEVFVRHYADRLCGFMFNLIGDADATQELVQDLFLWIWRNRYEWEIRGALTTYLYRSARNRAISHARHERLERRWREEMVRARSHPIRAAPTANPRNGNSGPH